MRFWLVPIAVFALLPAAAQAQQAVPQTPQEAAAHPDIVKDPICFSVRNEAAYKVFGNFVTNYYQAPDGTIARHRSNFRLDAAGSVDDKGDPSDRAEFCSYGPFYPEHRLELVLRSLFPIFNCMTKIDQGEIVIKGERKADDSGVKTWAECFE